MKNLKWVLGIWLIAWVAVYKYDYRMTGLLNGMELTADKTFLSIAFTSLIFCVVLLAISKVLNE